MAEKSKPKKSTEEALTATKAVSPSATELSNAAAYLAKVSVDPEASQDYRAIVVQAARDLARAANLPVGEREQAVQRASGLLIPFL